MKPWPNPHMVANDAHRKAWRKAHGLKKRVLSISQVDLTPRAQWGEGTSIDLGRAAFVFNVNRSANAPAGTPDAPHHPASLYPFFSDDNELQVIDFRPAGLPSEKNTIENIDYMKFV